MIEVKSCKYGRGVFATETIPKGTVIELSPVIIFPHTNGKTPNEEILDLYMYSWCFSYALALGYGSLFNHNSDPNVDYTLLLEEKLPLHNQLFLL